MDQDGNANDGCGFVDISGAAPGKSYTTAPGGTPMFSGRWTADEMRQVMERHRADSPMTRADADRICAKLDEILQALKR